MQVRLNSVYADNGDLANKIRLLEQSLQSQAAELDRARQNYSAKVQEFDSIKLQLVRVSEWEGRARDYENRIAYQKSEYDAKINRLGKLLCPTYFFFFVEKEIDKKKRFWDK